MRRLITIGRHTRRTKKGKVVVVGAHKKSIDTKPKRARVSTIELPFGNGPKKNYSGFRKRRFSLIPENKKQADYLGKMGLDLPVIKYEKDLSINERVGPREKVPIKTHVPIEKGKRIQRHKGED
jgi:hypothetical protein